MKDLIEYITKSIVDYPQEVEVTEREGSQYSVIQLKVSKKDLGKIIGRQGRIINSIRTILIAASSNEGKQYYLKILE